MDNNESESSSSQDFSIWLQSIVDYVRDAPTSCLNLLNIPWDVRDKDLQPVFEALVGSDITELHITGTTSLANKLQQLSGLLSNTKIEKLNLPFCYLKSDDFMSLMAVLKDTHITDLNLKKNHAIRLKGSVAIKTFIDHLVNSRLRSLNLSCSPVLPIEKMPVFFRRLPQTGITCLNLYGFFSYGGHSSRKIRLKSLYTLVSSLQNTVIKDLDLGFNKLGDDLAKTIGPFLEKSKLERLSLNSVHLTDFGVNLLMPGLIKSKITCLELRFNEINGDNILGRCLKRTRIKMLDLSHNSIINEKIFSGCKFVQGSDVSTLQLSRCFDFRENILPLAIKSLRFSKLTCLDLSSNNLTFEHVSSLFDVIMSNMKLTQINLAASSFSSECYRVLGEYVIKSNLKHINLSYSDMNEDSYARDVAQFIEKTKSSDLVSLNLCSRGHSFGRNFIAQPLANTTFLILDLGDLLRSIDIVRVAEQLKFTSIVALNLQACHIGDDGATVLAKYLGETKIVSLGLESNSINSRGAIALAQVLDKTRLRHLDLGYNHIGNDGLESLAEYAKNSCVTHINVEANYGRRNLLVYSVMWENRKKLQLFANLLKRTTFLTGGSNLFESAQDLVNIDVEVFIEDYLKLYKMVVKEPWLVSAIEQDKFISDLKNVKLFDCYHYEDHFSLYPCKYHDVDFFIEDCSLIYQKILEKVTLQNTTDQNISVSFRKQVLREILDDLPRKLVSFVASAIEADVEQHVSLLKKIEASGLTDLVELLLLNRPLYVIDENQDILHPHVYILLHKYKQPICNLEIEPKGVDKIVEYFANHNDLVGASDVISLLRGGVST